MEARARVDINRKLGPGKIFFSEARTREYVTREARTRRSRKRGTSCMVGEEKVWDSTFSLRFRGHGQGPGCRVWESKRPGTEARLPGM
jgi:hypothetical protein